MNPMSPFSSQGLSSQEVPTYSERKNAVASGQQQNINSLKEMEHAFEQASIGLKKIKRSAAPAKVYLKDPPLFDDDFLQSCQNQVKHLLEKYPNSTNRSPSKIARPGHGAQHQCRTALWALILLQMRREVGDPQAISFPNKWIKALTITCLLHDSGREADGPDCKEWEESSAKHCYKAIKEVLGDDDMAAVCSSAIINKDVQKRFPYNKTHAELLRSLLHDADVFDVIRTRENFGLEYLDAYREFSDLRPQLGELAKDVRDIISAQHDLKYATAISIPYQYSSTARNDLETAIPANYNEKFKIGFEHSDNALQRQFNHLAECKPALFNRLQSGGLVRESEEFWHKKRRKDAGHDASSKPASAPSSLTQMVRLSQGLGANKGVASGLHQELATGQKWYVKTGSELEVRHEKLMCELARTLGVDVPDVHIHQEAGEHCFLSRWREGLDKQFEKVSLEDKAKLMIAFGLLGNLDGMGSGGDNTMVGPKGKPVAIDWGEAGSLSCAKNGRYKEQGIFSSTPHELEVLIHPDTPSAKAFLEQYMPGWENSKATKKASDVFGDVKREHLVSEARALLNESCGDKLNDLITEYGPKKKAENNLLKRVIADRIAWLAIRYPEACDNLPVTPAEYHAIRTAGVGGYARQVSSADTEGGQATVFQRKTADDRTETILDLRLTRSAAKRLNTIFGASASDYFSLSQLNFYRNTLKKTTMTAELRHDLSGLSKRLEELKESLNDDNRWEIVGQNGKKAQCEDVRKALKNSISQLNSLLSVAEGKEVDLTTLPEVPFRMTCLPERVAPVAIEASTIQLAEFNHGFAKLTGYTQSVESATDRLPAYHHELLLDHNITARYYSDNLPDAQSLERQLTLVTPSDDQEACTRLFSALKSLGVNIERPSGDELQSRFLELLAADYGCEAEMAEVISSNNMGVDDENQHKRDFLEQKSVLRKGENPRWEEHCRFLQGQLHFYRPPYPFTNASSNESSFYGFHDVNYNPKNLEQRLEDLLLKVVHSGGSIDCSNERSRKGIIASENQLLAENIRQDAGSQVFSRVRDKAVQNKQAGLILSSAALARLGSLAQQSNRLREASTGFSYIAPFATKHFRVSAGQSGALASMANNPERNILNLTRGFSLYDEVDSITVTSSIEKDRVISALNPLFDTWPNGKSLDQLVTFTHDYHALTTQGLFAGLIKGVGPDQFDRFVRLNPRTSDGELHDMAGFKFQKANFKELGISDEGLRNSDLKGCVFTHCDLSKLNLCSLGTVEGCRFIKCQFDITKANSAELLKLAGKNYFPVKQMVAIYNNLSQAQRQTPEGCALKRKIEAMQGPLGSLLSHLMPEKVDDFLSVNPNFSTGLIHFMAGYDYEDAVFDDLTFSDFALKDANFKNCNFNHCDLSELELGSLGKLENCKFKNCKLNVTEQTLPILSKLQKNNTFSDDMKESIMESVMKNVDDKDKVLEWLRESWEPTISMSSFANDHRTLYNVVSKFKELTAFKNTPVVAKYLFEQYCSQLERSAGAGLSCFPSVFLESNFMLERHTKLLALLLRSLGDDEKKQAEIWVLEKMIEPLSFLMGSGKLRTRTNGWEIVEVQKLFLLLAENHPEAIAKHTIRLLNAYQRAEHGMNRHIFLKELLTKIKKAFQHQPKIFNDIANQCTDHLNTLLNSFEYAEDLVNSGRCVRAFDIEKIYKPARELIKDIQKIKYHS